MHTRKLTRRKGKKLKRIIFIVVSLFCITAIFFGIRVFRKKASFISPIPPFLAAHSSGNSALPTELVNREKITVLEQELTKNGITFSSVVIVSNSAFLITQVGGEKIIFSQNKDLASQISSLQLVLSRFTIEGKRLESLDFRYDRPVVKFQ